MKTFIVLVALFGCSLAQYITRGAGANYGLSGQSGVFGRSGLIGQSIQQGLIGGQTFIQPQGQFFGHSGIQGQAIQYQQPAFRQYSAPLSQIRSGLQYSPAQVAYQAPTQYTSSAIRTAGRTPAILRQSQDVSQDGAYNYGFESEDGIAVQAVGAVTPTGPEEGIHAAQGSYSYTAPDGTPITTTWYADETGFHAEGSHIPQGPAGHTRTV